MSREVEIDDDYMRVLIQLEPNSDSPIKFVNNTHNACTFVHACLDAKFIGLIPICIKKKI